MPTLAKKELEVSIPLNTLKELLDKKVPSMENVPTLKLSTQSVLDFKLADSSGQQSRYPTYVVKEVVLHEKGTSDKNTLHRDWVFSLDEVATELLAYAKKQFHTEFSRVKVDYVLVDNSDDPSYNPHVNSIKLFLSF